MCHALQAELDEWYQLIAVLDAQRQTELSLVQLLPNLAGGRLGDSEAQIGRMLFFAFSLLAAMQLLWHAGGGERRGDES